MKKLITLFALLITSSVVCLFAQNTEYDSLMQKAKDYESQKKYVYAMGTYWDAILATEDYEEASKAYTGYIDLVATFRSGKPGYGEYDEFSFYDAWQKAWNEWFLYKTEKSMYYIDFGKLKKGDLDYETRTASYSINPHVIYSKKRELIEDTLSTGYEKAKLPNWKNIEEEVIIKEFAKKKFSGFFYQDYSTWEKRNYGYSYTYRPEIRVKTGTKTYSDIAFVKDGKYRDGSDKLAIKEVNRTSTTYDYAQCASLDFNIVDKKGNLLFNCENIPIGYGEAFNVSFEKVSQDKMKIIDAEEYTIIPVGLNLISGYLSQDPTDAELKNLLKEKIEVSTISTIKDVNLNKFYEKQKAAIIENGKKNEEIYKGDIQLLLEASMVPLPESCYDILIGEEYFLNQLNKWISSRENAYVKVDELNEKVLLKQEEGFEYIILNETESTKSILSIAVKWGGRQGSYLVRLHNPKRLKGIQELPAIKEKIAKEREEALQTQDKELKIEKLMRAIPDTNLDIMISPVTYKITTMHNSKEIICNDLSECTSLDVVYKEDRERANSYIKNLEANGFRIAEQEELRAAKYNGLIDWNEQSKDLYVVRKHNDQKLNSIKGIEEKLFADEEAKRLELEKLAEENRLKYEKAEEDRKLKLEEQNKKIQAEKQRELEERNKQTDERFVAYDKNPWKGDVEYDDLQRYVNCYLKDLKKNITIQVVNIQQPEIFNKMPFNLNQSYSGKNKITFDFRKVNFQEAWPYYKDGDKTNRTDYTQIQFIYRSINSFDGYISAVIFPKTLQDIIQKQEPQLLEKLNKQYPKAGSIIKFK